MGTSQWPDFPKSPQKTASPTHLHPASHCTCLLTGWGVRQTGQEMAGKIGDQRERTADGIGERSVVGGIRRKRPKRPTLPSDKDPPRTLGASSVR